VTESDTERILRESLRRRAERAPDGGELAERILAGVGGGDSRVGYRSFRWQTWVTPLVSAAAVAAVAVAVVQVATPARRGSHTVAAGETRDPYAVSASASDSGSAGRASCAGARCERSSAVVAPGRGPSSVRPSGTGAGAASSGADASGTDTAAGAGTGSALSGFRVSDLTFVSDTVGWAFGTARCLDGSAGRCPAMMQTTDGRTWHSMPPPPVDAGHDQLGIRFADDQVGYAFDPTVLFMTTDGGRTWQRQSGGALALETLDGNVVRLVSGHSGCPGPCDLTVERAAVGAATWQQVGASRPLSGVSSVQLVRSGSEVYVLIRRNPAGGAPDQTSTLLSFPDTGAVPQSDGEPCPQGGARASSSAGGEVDGVAVSAGVGSTVAVLCQPRSAGQDAFVATSARAGQGFTATAGALPAGVDLLAGDPAAVLLAGGAGRLGVYRSTDGGASWHLVPGLGAAGFLGFESPQVARAVSADGSVVWTTTDGGASWAAVRFR
jgi:hypothetical protein